MAAGKFFDPKLLDEIRDHFLYVDHDFDGTPWTFLDSAAGGFKLKVLPEIQAREHAIPGQEMCDPRDKNSKRIHEYIEKGKEDARIFFNAKDGGIYWAQTASLIISDMIWTFAMFGEGTNLVSTNLEHPSSIDSMKQAAELFNKELRIAKVDPKTGRVPEDEIIGLVDENTVAVSFVHGSNCTGVYHDAAKIIKGIRAKNPKTYILLDGVQYAPNGPIDVDALKPDAYAFGPYKFSCCRGLGLGYLSERASVLPHHRLNGHPKNQWMLGSKNNAVFASWSATCDYLCWLGAHFTESQDRRELIVAAMSAIKDHMLALCDLALNGTDEVPGLRSIPNVTVYGDGPEMKERNLMLTYSIDGMDVEKANAMYYDDGVHVRVRYRDGFAIDMLNAVGCSEAALRVSASHVHRPEDIIRFLEVTKKISDCVK